MNGSHHKVVTVGQITHQVDRRGERGEGDPRGLAFQACPSSPQPHGDASGRGHESPQPMEGRSDDLPEGWDGSRSRCPRLLAVLF